MDFGFIDTITICSWTTALIKALSIMLSIASPMTLFIIAVIALSAVLLVIGIRQEWAKITILKVTYIIIASIVGFALFILFILLYSQILSLQCNIPTTIDLSTMGETNVRNIAFAFIGTVSGLGGLFGVYLAILKSEENKRQSDSAEIESAAARLQSEIANRQADTAEQGLITDRLNKATEGLGKSVNGEPVLEVRLGALYALERIAQDSIRDHVQVMEIMCAYVRTNSPVVGDMNKIDTITPLRKDIQTALTIIRRREYGKGGAERLEKEQTQGYQIDLSHCDLHKADLIGADLSRAKINHSYMRFAKLDRANLTGAEIDGTNLVSAELRGANLSYAKISNTDKIENLAHVRLMEANLSHAEIKDSNLVEAILLGADLSHAEIKDSHLTKARLDGANMSHVKLFRSDLTNAKVGDADMSDAKIYCSCAYEGDFRQCKNLTQPQLKDMFLDKNVKLPKGLTNPLKGTDYYKHYDKIENFKKDYKKWVGVGWFV